MLIRDYKRLMEFHHIGIEQMLEKYAKQNCKNIGVSNIQYEMINYNDYTNENKTKHNPKWPYIPDHPYKMLIEVLDDEKQILY